MRSLVYRRRPSAVRAILEGLPDWFGDPEAIDNYELAAADPKFVSLLALDGGEVVGAALIRRHFPETAEIHLIAVAHNHRGQRIGRALVDKIAGDLAADGCSMLTVHTVGPSFDNQPYANTRAFYRAAGFVPLEEHNNLDWAGPTLIMARALQPGSRDA